MSILTQAEALVNGARQADYNDPTVNFELIAKLSSLLTKQNLSARDCCLVLIAVKLSREIFKHKEDNLTDLCGYAEILNRIEEKNEKRSN